ncbi:MAG: phospho-N-acetylmuramoyl-pentapeptide-transferase [Verrucomicrobia bacterium]|nr:phospho-N-acetylmuramoyl-pentapeptide-transferase [Verrucomicrobiota bacterium]
MIPFFLDWLMKAGFKVPTLFLYASSRMIFATLTTVVLSILFGRLFITKLCALKVGHTVRISDVPALREQYKKDKDVPSMGGILFITQIFLASLLWMDFTSAFTWILLFTMLSMGALGAIDDYAKLKKRDSKGIPPRAKMALQLLLSFGLMGYLWTATPHDKSAFIKPPVAKEKHEGGAIKELTAKEYSLQYYLPFCKNPIVLTGLFGAAVAFLFTTFVISGSANAVNLTDGLDGLAAGLALFVAFVLAVVAFLSNHTTIAHYLNILYIEGSSEIAVFLAATMGALLGFLWFNGYPAEIFMGDTGSLAIGGILGVSAVLLRREFLLALVGGVFVAETLSVILQVWSVRYRGGKRIFKCAPLHHHFQITGWHETKIVMRFWMIGLILSLIGLASLKVQ